MSINFVYGRHPVSEALRSKPCRLRKLFVAQPGQRERFSDLLRTAEHLGIPVAFVPKSRLDRMVEGAPHQGVVAEVPGFAYADASEIVEGALRDTDRDDAGSAGGMLVALDQIQDPHNLGALIRSAYALGAHGLFIPKDRACEVTATAIKASAGAAAHLPVGRVVNIKRQLQLCKEAGFWVIGTVAQGGKPLYDVDLKGNCVIVVGSEGQGMRRTVEDACDVLVRIPMSGSVGSLNASVAGAIVLYEAARQRGLGEPGKKGKPAG